CFFFQAEDGIRDDLVTGVQTCALPISREIGREVGGVELYEPVPAAMVRLAGRERAQLLVQSNSRTALHTFLAAWRDLLAAQRSRDREERRVGKEGRRRWGEEMLHESST